MEKYNVVDFKQYLEGLNDLFDVTNMWRKLQNKAELGLDKSEKGYQTIAAINAEMTAEKLNLNPKLASLFTKILGCYFPACGSEGKKCLLEYANSHGLNISEVDLAVNMIEYDLDLSNVLVANGLSDVLRELFDENKVSQIPEIELAKLYHEITEVLKLAYAESREKYEEAKKIFDDEVVVKIQEKGINGYLNDIKSLKVSMKKNEIKMTEEDKKAYCDSINLYLKGSDYQNAIIRFASLETEVNLPSNQKQK